MPFGKGRRKWFWAVGCLLVGVAVVWLSLPVWLPWALRPLAARVGARFSACERLGYSRFALDNLALTNQSVVIHARRIEAFVPSVWLWKLAASAHAAGSPFLQLDHWDCHLLPSGNTNASPPFSQIQDLAKTLRVLQRWVPTAALEARPGAVGPDNRGRSVRNLEPRPAYSRVAVAITGGGAHGSSHFEPGAPVRIGPQLRGS